MATIVDLAQKVKAKYPGEYDDLSDIELGRRVKAKYPEYSDFTDVTEPKAAEATPRSLVSKSWRMLNKALNVASEPATKKVYAPLAEKLPVDEAAKTRLKAIEQSKEMKYPSDVAQAVVPTLFDPLQKLPGEAELDPASQAINLGKTAARIGIDIAADPLSYVGIGMPTKLGKLLRTAHELKLEGQPIKLSSQLAKDIAREVGANKPSPQMVNDFLKRIPAKTSTTQVEAGQRSLLSVINPLTNEPIGKLHITGKLPAKLIKPLSMAKRSAIGSKIEGVARDLFSTKSGNPDFDVMLSKFRSQVEYRRGLKLEDARKMNKEADELAKGLNITRDELNNHINEVGEAVVPLTKQESKAKYGKDVYDKMLGSFQDGLIDATLNLKKATKAGDKELVDQYAKEVVDYNSEINKITGKYKPPPAINPEVDKFIKNVTEKNAQQLLRDQTAGVQVQDLMADRAYLPHIITQEAARSYADMLRAENKFPKKMATKEFNDELANHVQRQFVQLKPIVIDAWRDAGIITKREARSIKTKNISDGLDKLKSLLENERITQDQFTDAVHSLSIKEVQDLPLEVKQRVFGSGIKEDTQIFHSDPIYHTTVRGIRGEVASTSAEFFTEMRKRGLAIPDANAPKDWINVKQEELAGHKVPTEVARVLNKWHDINTKPGVLRDALKLYDQVHSLQKIWTLAPFPAYHTMNAVGNFWNNYLAGVTNPDVYRQALMTQLNRINAKFRPVNFRDALGNKWNTDKLNQAMHELGVLGRGQYSADAERTIKQLLEGGKFLTLSSRSHFLRVGQRLGKFIEDNARAAHFIDRLRKGDTAEQAALSVKKYLFDYGDMTQFEKEKLNRLFFFYQWTRKNIPLQLHSLVTTPAKMSVPFKAKYEIEKNTPQPDERFLPEYVKENFPTRYRYNSKTNEPEYFMLNRWLPAADLVKLVHLHDVALNMVAPIPKELVQQAWNTDFFTKKKIQNIPGEKVEFLHKKLPVRLVHIAKTIRLLNEIDKMSSSDADLMSKIVTLSTGKNYIFDEQQGKVMNKRRVDDEINTLRSALYKEKLSKHPDQKEVDRIIQLINQKAQEYTH